MSYPNERCYLPCIHRTCKTHVFIFGINNKQITPRNMEGSPWVEWVAAVWSHLELSIGLGSSTLNKTVGGDFLKRPTQMTQVVRQ